MKLLIVGYGRNGLRSRTEWLQFVALKTAAARQVAREHGIGTVWSWGWGTYNLRGRKMQEMRN